MNWLLGNLSCLLSVIMIHGCKYHLPKTFHPAYIVCVCVCRVVCVCVCVCACVCVCVTRGASLTSEVIFLCFLQRNATARQKRRTTSSSHQSLLTHTHTHTQTDG